jgi:carbon storage regulator CsrA
MIGDDVEVTVLAVQGEKVRLGIEAPSEVPVHRTEIYLEIEQEREKGAQRTDPESGAEDVPRGHRGSREQG